MRSDTEGKSVTKVSRTFSYLKNKMYKKTRVREPCVFNGRILVFAPLYCHLLVTAVRSEISHLW